MTACSSVCAKMPLCVSVRVFCIPWFVFLVILLAFTKDTVEAQKIKDPSSEFTQHSIARPVLHHASTGQRLSTTKHTDGLHHRQLTLTVDLDGEEQVLDLTLNEDLVSGNHVLNYQRNGEMVQHTPSKEEHNICQYRGTVRHRPSSWAAVSTCHGVRGVIYDGSSFKYIEPAGHNLDSHHYVYSHSQLKEEKPCGYRGGVTNNSHYDPELMAQYNNKKKLETLAKRNRYKRSTDEALVRGPYNSNRNSRYVELVLVADNGEFLASGGDVRLVEHNMKDVANIINSMYAPLNIFIALVGVIVWSERDEIQLLENGDDTLTNFLQYRRSRIQTPNDNAQLLTSQKFTGGVVGKALKGPICTYEFSGGVSTNHSSQIGLVAATIAHEMGHNFGMEHDTVEDCTCPDEKCIMSPSSTSVVPLHWSSCSLKSLALAFDRGMDYCLRNKPPRLFDSPTCGNGFVEPGEQCDCGGGLPCLACCRPDCTLRGNATCAAGECCDLQTCRPRAPGHPCRSADRECDLPEYCTGHSEYCPSDVHKMDSTPCGEQREAYCVRGACRSHTAQCRLLWGVTGEMSHVNCYNTVNTRGSDQGNCGYDRVNKQYKQCKPPDAMCGLLHCKHLNERLEFGMESVSTLSHTFINDNGTIAACRTALIDLGQGQVDPGMVPDGAKCGTDKMCLHQRCISVATFRQELSSKETSVCPSNCSGHGVCNSEGHCHCEPGFSPPLCETPGPGGSYDSGPATDPSAQRRFMVAMYIIFLGIIPSILLVLFLIYYSKHNVLLWWKKPAKTVQSPKKSSLQRRISRGASKLASSFHPPPPPGGGVQQEAVTPGADDMSSSLLRSDSDRSPTGNINPSVNFFGNFKGFSLTPIEREKDKAQPETQRKSEPEVATASRSAKITPVHRTGSQNFGVLKPVLRTAPPLPVVPVSSPKTSPTVKRTNSTVHDRIKAMMNTEKTEFTHNTPVLQNPVRPVISSPILEASTCTAKELISPLQGSKTLGPARAAPNVPTISPGLPKRPLSMHSQLVPQKPLPEEPKKVKEGISLNRIASFLKPDKPKEKERNPVERSHSLPKNPMHLIRIPKTADKLTLKNLQISNPILQKDIELPVNTVPVVSDTEDDDAKAFVNRTQSMRAPGNQKPVLQSFGSMRQAPGVPRPLSTAGRPTAPPPPLPNPTSHYQNPKPIEKDYVDCIEEKQAPLAHIDEEHIDNIYAIIEESPEKNSKPLPGVPPPIKTVPTAVPEGYNTPRPVASGSNESMGLLGEIVCEIQNRNFDSIYSASTLKRKKEKAQKAKEEEYMNSEYKTPESVYSNSGAKSNASTTSSGYLHPSAVNVPNFMKNKEEEKVEPPPSPTMKVNSKIPTFSRQVTPPGLKTTTTFKSVPQSPKITPKNLNRPINANSPDVVSSCETKNAKPPDVINNNKQTEPPKVAAKPNSSPKVNDNTRPPSKPVVTEKKPIKTTQKPVVTKTEKPVLNRVNSKVDSNVKAIADNLNKNKPKIVPKPSTIGVQRTDSNIKPSATKLAAKPSSVASLQQKFENRKSIGRDLTGAKKSQ